MKKIVWLVLVFLVPCGSKAADKLTLTAKAGKFNRIDCVASADISTLNTPTNESFKAVLYEQTGKEKKAVPSQLLVENGRTSLFWILDGATPAGATRTFIVERTAKSSANPSMDVEDTRKALIVKQNGKPVLQYNYAHTEPPAGIDKAYGRSGFIHPAYSPAGNVLTVIQPKDHYHHYGIWNPWTSIEYDGIHYDLWNLGDKLGTVRAKAIEAIWQGNVFSGYAADLDHVIFRPEGERKIIDERWNVKAWNVKDGFLWDFESCLKPSTTLPVLLKAYRYAGFGYRATEEWTKENSEMFTSEGHTRQQIDGTTARWIYVTGDTKSGRSGLLFLGHPENCNAPEPLRIWDENANDGRGDVFINFAPTKNKDWELAPGKQYVLRYRVLSYEGEMTQEHAEQLWNDFAYPPSVEVNKVK